MGGRETDQEMPRLPRAESVVTEERAARPRWTEYRAFGVAAEDFARHLAMLEVRRRTGDRCLFAYHLLGRVDWNVSLGMVLVFGDATVSFTGRNLAPLFSAVRDQKAAWVQEADVAAAELVPPTETVVESVTIETRAAAR